MSVAEAHHHSDPAAKAAALLAWDWRAALKREERSLSWLARHTERSESAVNKYARGVLIPPLDWLRAAAIALKVEV